MKILKLIPLFIIALYFNAEGQTYLGLSTNIGNKLSFNPNTDGLKRAPSISGSLVIMKRQKMKSNWFIQYSGELGILGYQLKIVSLDTLHSPNEFNFFDYSVFYGSLGLSAGKEYYWGAKKGRLGFGGGLVVYECLSSVQYAIGNIDKDNNTHNQIFFAGIDCAPNKLSGFIKVTSQLELNKIITVGLEYSHNFSPVLLGRYEFYHTSNPNYGTISLYQREIKLLFLIRVSKKQ